MDNGLEVHEVQTREGPKYSVYRSRMKKRLTGVMFRKKVDVPVKEVLLENAHNGVMFFCEEGLVPYTGSASVAYFLSRETAESFGKRVTGYL